MPQNVEYKDKNPVIGCCDECKRFVDINGHSLAFYFFGNGEKTVVFLHGWGANADAFMFVAKQLCVKYRMLIVDFAGFGDSDYPPENYGVKEYANDIVKLLEVLNINNAMFVAHSFGGRVAIEICANYPHLAEKLVLVDSAGIKPRRGFRYYCKVAVHKILRKLGRSGLKGSSDYNVLPSQMKCVFKRVVNYDQKSILKNIKSPTAVFWGDRDNETPMYMYKTLLGKIEYSHGFLLNGGHFAYIEDSFKFVAILSAFLEN